MEIISRQEAISRGLKRYFTGKPCNHGHIAERIVSNSRCFECARIADREFKVKNRERLNEKAREYFRSESRKENTLRRSRKICATPPWFGELDEFVWREAADLRLRRESATGVPWAADHMIPLSGRRARGLHVWNNCQVIPASLNLWKHNKLVLTSPGEWIARL